MEMTLIKNSCGTQSSRRLLLDILFYNSLTVLISMAGIWREEANIYYLQRSTDINIYHMYVKKF